MMSSASSGSSSVSRSERSSQSAPSALMTAAKRRPLIGWTPAACASTAAASAIDAARCPPPMSTRLRRVMFVTPVAVTIEYQQMTDTPLTATRLWKSMTPAQRVAAADAFWRDEEATEDQIQAVMLIAQQKKFRPKSVIALDVERKARHLASIVQPPRGGSPPAR